MTTHQSYPATFAQHGMMLHSSAHSTDTSFDLGFVFAIGQEADPVRLVAATRVVFESAVGLSTTFHHTPHGFEARPGTGAARVIEIDITDPSILSPDDYVVEETERFIKSGPIAPTDPHQVTARFYHGKQGYYLGLVASHLVGDAYSFYRVIGAISEAYAAADEHWPTIMDSLKEHPGTVNVPDVPSRAFDRYRDLVATAGTPGTLAGIGRIGGQIVGTHQRRTFDASAAQAVRTCDLVEHYGAATVFFTAYAATLGRLSGAESVVLGVPVAGRAGHRAKNAVGFFVNTLPLPIRLNAGESWRDLCARISSGIRVLQMNQGLDFAAAREASRIGAELPPIDNAVTYYGQDLCLQLPGIQVRSLPLTRTDLPYPLTVTVSDDGTTYSTDVAVCDELAEAGAEDYFHDALLRAVHDPESPAIEDSVFDTGNATGPADFRPKSELPTVVELIEHEAERRPEAIALVHGDQKISYGQLQCRMASSAEALDAAGATALVVVKMPKGVDAIISILGVLASGRAYVPVDPDAPQQRTALILQRVTSELGTPPNIIVETPQANGEFAAAALTHAGDRIGRRSTASAADRAYIIFTSGSTGEPKGVVISHAALSSLLDSALQATGAGRGDRWCLFHSMAFDFSVWEIFGPLTSGGCLVIPEERQITQPDAFAEFLQTAKIGVLNQTPSAFRRLTDALERSGSRLPHTHTVVFGGEALHPADLRNWPSLGESTTKFVNMYGITETTVHVTAKLLSHDEIGFDHRSLIGGPLAHLQLLVIDGFGRETPLAVPGQLLVLGDSLAEGYLGRPELTAERFPLVLHDGSPRRAYLTGDRVRRDPDGELVYLGRIDDQVQLRGYRIELGEIEAAIAATALTRAATVRLVCPDHSEPFLCAWVVGAGTRFDVEALREDLRHILPSYMLPARFVEMDAIPMTQNGKPDVSRLALPQAETLPGDGSLASQIARVWEETIGAGRITAQDRFMDVGGTSMHLMKVHDRLRTELGLETLTLVDLFEHATPQDLANHVMARHAS